jgi:deazaflavin-dependent oxidoreductase (nitroreductase family)
MAEQSRPNASRARVIEEFRAHRGEVGGYFESMSLLLLGTTGARSGLPRVAPLTYMAFGERYIVIAGNAGEPTNPDWYYNIAAEPQVTVEVAGETFEALAEEVVGSERDALYDSFARENPQTLVYQARTERRFPVVALTRVPGGELPVPGQPAA